MGIAITAIFLAGEMAGTGVLSLPHALKVNLQKKILNIQKFLTLGFPNCGLSFLQLTENYETRTKNIFEIS